MGVGFAAFPVVSGSPKYSDSTFSIKSFIFVSWKDPLPENVCGEKRFSDHQVVPPGSCTGKENFHTANLPSPAVGLPAAPHL